ncbi:MAG: RsmD family RNA methyltransferase [Armatimonadota bacterium]
MALPPPAGSAAAAQLPVLSHFQAAGLLDARREGRASVEVSPDLNLTQVEVQLNPQGATFPGGERVSWSWLERIAESGSACFLIGDDGPEPIQLFSPATERFLSLMPTESAPTLLVAGFPMHRIKGTDPYHDTLSKIGALLPLTGRVLDTATGLGYTAIEAARTASRVVTIELDPAVLRIARLNPWSQSLFREGKITQVIGDSTRVVRRFRGSAFSCVIHDPPTFALAGQLYSGEFYRQLHRVLASGGRLFHYLGDPTSESGARVGRGAVRRLHDAGFARVRAHPEAFGVVAVKG